MSLEYPTPEQRLLAQAVAAAKQAKDAAATAARHARQAALSETRAAESAANIPESGMPAFSGDITTQAGSTVATIGDYKVTYQKMQRVANGDRILGRESAGEGPIEEIVCTAAARDFLDDPDTATQLDTLGALPVAGGTMGGNLNLGTHDLLGVKNTGYQSEPHDSGDKGGASQVIDWAQGNVQKCRLTQNVSSTLFSPPPAVTGGLILLLSQDGVGGRTFGWPVSVKWDRGVAPVLSTAANATDMVGFVWDGTVYRGSFWRQES